MKKEQAEDLKNKVKGLKAVTSGISGYFKKIQEAAARISSIIKSRPSFPRYEPKEVAVAFTEIENVVPPIDGIPAEITPEEQQALTSVVEGTMWLQNVLDKGWEYFVNYLSTREDAKHNIPRYLARNLETVALLLARAIHYSKMQAALEKANAQLREIEKERADTIRRHKKQLEQYMEEANADLVATKENFDAMEKLYAPFYYSIMAAAKSLLFSLPALFILGAFFLPITITPLEFFANIGLFAFALGISTLIMLKISSRAETQGKQIGFAICFFAAILIIAGFSFKLISIFHYGWGIISLGPITFFLPLFVPFLAIIAIGIYFFRKKKEWEKYALDPKSPAGFWKFFDLKIFVIAITIGVTLELFLPWAWISYRNTSSNQVGTLSADLQPGNTIYRTAYPEEIEKMPELATCNVIEFNLEKEADMEKIFRFVRYSADIGGTNIGSAGQPLAEFRNKLFSPFKPTSAPYQVYNNPSGNAPALVQYLTQAPNLGSRPVARAIAICGMYRPNVIRLTAISLSVRTSIPYRLSNLVEARAAEIELLKAYNKHNACITNLTAKGLDRQDLFNAMISQSLSKMALSPDSATSTVKTPKDLSKEETKKLLKQFPPGQMPADKAYELSTMIGDCVTTWTQLNKLTVEYREKFLKGN